MTNNYQQREHQTGLILTPLEDQITEEGDFLSKTTTEEKTPIKNQTTIHALRHLRDSNPSLLNKLTYHINGTNDENDTFIEYWNSIQEIVSLHDDDHSIIGLNLGGLMVRIKTLVPFIKVLCNNYIYDKLKILNLGGTDIPLSNLLEAFQLNTDKGSIEKLYLSGCSISYQRNGIQDLISIMKTNTCSNLTTLDLRYNDLLKSNQNESEKQDLMSFFRNVLSESKIEILHLEGNNLDDDIMESISYILSNSKYTLKELYLGSNKIQADGARYLAHSLYGNRVLQKLYLECNLIGNAGVEEFCVLLEKTKSKKLYLGEEGKTCGGDTQSDCIVLNKLWVENNGVGKEMMKRLGEALPSDSIIGDF